MNNDSEDFSIILASSIHDVKNSIGVLLNSLEMMLSDAHENDNSHTCTTDDIAQLEYQTKRISNNLVQLLAIYRIDNENYEPFIQEHNLRDFFEDCISLNTPLLHGRSISVECKCDETLEWSFDENLISGAVNNTIVNISRYTNAKLLISVNREGNYLRIDIEDDGRGYPDLMLDYSSKKQKIDFSSGSTGLGIHFIDISTRLHSNGKESGYMQLSNGGRLGGGQLSIFLPAL